MSILRTHSYWATRWIVALVAITILLCVAVYHHSVHEPRPLSVVEYFKPEGQQNIYREKPMSATNDVSKDVLETDTFKFLSGKPTGGNVLTDNDFKSVNKGDQFQQKTESTSSIVITSADRFIRDRFLNRSQQAKNVCSKMTSADLYPVHKIKGPKSLFAQKHFSWCHVPKVGTTFLMELNKQFQRGKKGSKDQKKSFFIVREPFSRMVSGYIGKIVTNQPWWVSYGKLIVQKFRVNATQKEKDCGNDVTFPEFVKYVIHAQESGWRKDPHFVPMHELCNPCTSFYDYILHLETLKDDLPYILESVNITANLDYSDESITIKGKASSIVSQKKKITKCESMCTALRKVWWSFHARGLISKDIHFPVKEDECDSISKEEFVTIALDAHSRSVGQIDKSKQKRDAMIELFLQVPLSDRLKVRDLLAFDFELYGYNPQPSDLFPELSKSRE